MIMTDAESAVANARAMVADFEETGAARHTARGVIDRKERYLREVAEA